MKKIILFALLIASVAGTTTSFAQDAVGTNPKKDAKTGKKEGKMDKKEAKGKDGKAMKKSEKMDKKDTKSKM